jgi:hypothetical protein
MQFTRPQILAMLEFQGADIWGEDGAEEFYDKSPLDCALRLLDESFVPQTGAVVEWLQTNPTFITVVAHKRNQVEVREVEGWGEGTAENLREWFCEEYGDPNMGDDGLPDDDIQELRRRSVELTAWYVSKARVYTCEPLRSFRLDSGDILELVQQCRAHWMLNPS